MLLNESRISILELELKGEWDRAFLGLNCQSSLFSLDFYNSSYHGRSGRLPTRAKIYIQSHGIILSWVSFMRIFVEV